MGQVLSSDSDFEAFLLDHFDSVYRLLGTGMGRLSKENLLFEHEKCCVILHRLRQHNPKRCEDFLGLLVFGHRDDSLRNPYQEALSFAGNLDRWKQEAAVIKTCESHVDSVFLLHGGKDHCLTFFLDRLPAKLASKTGKHFCVYVPFKYGISQALRGDEWVKHIYSAIKRQMEVAFLGEYRIPPTLEQMINIITQNTPLFIILGNKRPLEITKKSEAAGIVEFIGRNLPKLISHRKSCAVRVLVPIEYDKYDEKLIEPIRVAMLKLPSPIRFINIDSPQVPDWDEILDFLRKIKRHDSYTGEITHLSEKEIQECKKRYERIKKSGWFSFHRLVEELKSVIEP